MGMIKLPTLLGAAIAASALAFPASALTVFTQSGSGTITFDPGAGAGPDPLTGPGPGTSLTPVVITLNFGGFLGTAAHLAGEELLGVNLNWDSVIDGSTSNVAIQNNDPGTIATQVEIQSNQNLTAPGGIDENLALETDSIPAGAGAPGLAIIDSGNSNTATFEASAQSSAASVFSGGTAAYLTPFANDDIVVTISADFADQYSFASFTGGSNANVIYDFFIEKLETVTLTYISDFTSAAPTAAPVPSALLLLAAGLGGLVVRKKVG